MSREELRGEIPSGMVEKEGKRREDKSIRERQEKRQEGKRQYHGLSLSNQIQTSFHSPLFHKFQLLIRLNNKKSNYKDKSKHTTNGIANNN